MKIISQNSNLVFASVKPVETETITWTNYRSEEEGGNKSPNTGSVLKPSKFPLKVGVKFKVEISGLPTAPGGSRVGRESALDSYVFVGATTTAGYYTIGNGLTPNGTVIETIEDTKATTYDHIYFMWNANNNGSWSETDLPLVTIKVTFYNTATE